MFGFSQVSQHPACLDESIQTRKTIRYIFNYDYPEFYIISQLRIILNSRWENLVYMYPNLLRNARDPLYPCKMKYLPLFTHCGLISPAGACDIVYDSNKEYSQAKFIRTYSWVTPNLRWPWSIGDHCNPQNIDNMGRLQKHSLAIVYRNQWLNWFP